MKYVQLYNYLRSSEELSRVQAVRSIMGVRKLDPEIKKAMGEWARTGQCRIEIAGVSFKELTEKEGMKPVRAFRMLDWLKREPRLAKRYMVQRHLRADLSKVGSAHIAADIEEKDKSDIDL